MILKAKNPVDIISDTVLSELIRLSPYIIIGVLIYLVYSYFFK